MALTFDGATKDLITFAYPVLARHAVPFTVYVPTAFPDGVGEAWWLGLEQVIARESRISLMMGEKEQRFTVDRQCREAGAVFVPRGLVALAAAGGSVGRDRRSLHALPDRPRVRSRARRR